MGGPGLLSGVQSLQNSYYGFCAVLTSGGVDCWGYNAYGELGNGGTTDSATPVQVVGVGGTGLLGGVQSLESAYYGFCAILTSGGVDCWGLGDNGELGNGTVGDSTTPVQVSDVAGTGLLSGVQSLSSSYYGYCAVLTSSDVDCWGYGGDGGLGNGTTADSDIPVQVSDVSGAGLLSGVQSLSSSYVNCCAVLTSGGVDCWGYNAYGGLGNGTTTDSVIPVQVSDVSGTGVLAGVQSADSNYYGYCAVLTAGGVDCWGYDGDGELGNGTTTDSSIPVQVVDVPGTGVLTGAQSLSSSTYGYSFSNCAVLTSGGVDCWGYDGDGELGNGSMPTLVSTPVQVIGVGGTGLLGGGPEPVDRLLRQLRAPDLGRRRLLGLRPVRRPRERDHRDSATPVQVSGVEAPTAAFSVPSDVPSPPGGRHPGILGGMGGDLLEPVHPRRQERVGHGHRVGGHRSGRVRPDLDGDVGFEVHGRLHHPRESGLLQDRHDPRPAPR